MKISQEWEIFRMQVGTSERRSAEYQVIILSNSGFCETRKTVGGWKLCPGAEDGVDSVNLRTVHFFQKAVISMDRSPSLWRCVEKTLAFVFRLDYILFDFIRMYLDSPSWPTRISRMARSRKTAGSGANTAVHRLAGWCRFGSIIDPMRWVGA